MRSPRSAFGVSRRHLVLLTVLAAACGSTTKDAARGDGGTGDATVDGPTSLNFGNPDGATNQSLVISPTNATLTVTSLTASATSPFPTQTFTASKVVANASPVPAAATWTTDRVDIASIDPSSGVLTPSGAAFGVVTVTASAQGLTASTTITVALKAVIDTTASGANDGGSGSALGDAGAFAFASDAGALANDPAVTRFAYPYDATVFPRGLIAPELMWNGGAAGDLYSVHLTAPSFDVALYTTADPPSRFPIPKAVWDALTASAGGKTATCDLYRLSGGTEYASAHETWTIADANLSGSIYYWAISEAVIVKLDLATGTVAPVFDPGPSATLGTPTPLNSSAPSSPPWQDNGIGNGKRCVACHSVSKDGSTLTSVFSTPAGSTGPLGFYNFANNAVQAISDYTQYADFNALTPDGKEAVANFTSKTMQLKDTSTGATVPSTLDQDGGIANACDPSFSPDGTLFAFAANCVGGANYPIEFNSSDLALYSFAPTAPYFTNLQTVIKGSGAGDAIAFPSFSPDSKFIFYQRGSYSRAKYTTPAFFHGIDDLYVTPAKSADAGAVQIALTNANSAGIATADSLHVNYAPTVNPIASGGYIWVVFTTPRDYGNRMVSPQLPPAVDGGAPQDASWSNHKQLWVTAVDANIGTVDPSHPAFWLPGQDPASINMFGYWALAPCKATVGDGGAASTCSSGFECCTGFCRADADGGPAVCTGEPAGCHQEGEKCTTTADCCTTSANIQCSSGICQAASPK